MPWPFMSSQCPSCHYFAAFEPHAYDDAGYCLPGVCRHPSIGMELFVASRRPELGNAGYSLRWPLSSEPASTKAGPPRATISVLHLGGPRHDPKVSDDARNEQRQSSD
jgi:hypothetical protein